MEALIFITCIIIVIVLLTLKSDVNGHLQNLRDKINHLDREIQRIKLSQPSDSLKTDISIDEKDKQTFRPKPIEPEPIPERFVELPLEKVSPPSPQTILTPEPVQETYFEPQPIPESVQIGKPPKKTFFEQNPDLEKFIGENLANKIGIGILVIGIGFFVKYAIDHSWINPLGRVMIGVLCGGGLIGVGHYMRNKFRAFSSVMAGGGIAVLYITITIAFQLFHLFEAPVAFTLMVFITGFTIALSLGYDRIELAVLAILGGFGSPFMVSTGEGNYKILFTYLLILNVGMMVLANYKKWNLVNIICYIFTVLIFGSWMFAKFDGQNLEMLNWELFFSTAFYLVFFAMNIINNLKERRQFQALEFTMLLSNTFFYYSAGMYTLSFNLGYPFRGLFTISLAIFNFIFAFLLYKNQKADRNLVFLLIGLVLTFISLAAPIQLEGNYITVFWAAEAVLLLWLSQKSGIQLMKLASLIVNLLMVISLMMDWYHLYFQSREAALSIVINKAYITGIFSVISLSLSIIFLKYEKDVEEFLLSAYKSILMLTAIVGFYCANLFELQYQLKAYEVSETAFSIVSGTYNMLFILVLILLEPRLTLPDGIRKLFAGWGLLAIVLFVGLYHKSILDARIEYIALGTAGTGFFMHYILTSLLVGICIASVAAFRKLAEFNRETRHAYSWIYMAFFVFLASYELDHIVLLINSPGSESYMHLIAQNHKIGWPILWGSAAFIIIFVGLKHKILHLRIISLALFLITLLKLFLVDLKGISEAGKIAAFISLGVLLLIVSFMYQRLKKLLLEGDSVKEQNSSAEV